MYLKKVLSAILVPFIIAGCGTQTQDKKQVDAASAGQVSLKGNLSISGAYALYPLVRKWAEDFMALHPEVEITVTATGTGAGIEDLIAQKCQLAMISRQLTDDDIASGVWTVPVAKDGVAPIVSQKNPCLKTILRKGLSTDEFSRVFTVDEPVTWGELLDTTVTYRAVPVIREDESGAADVWAEYMYKSATDLKGVKVTGDEEMIKLVSENPYAIGFCNFSFAFDVESGEKLKEIQIVPFDLDFDDKIESREIPFTNLEKTHRGLWLGLYPKCLCRELTIGSIGRPTDGIAAEFIRYSLTTGQEDIKKTGLCELNNVYIRHALERLQPD